MLESWQVKFNFPKEYENYSHTQHLQGKRLISRLNLLIGDEYNPKRIIDLGCGTGSFTWLVSKRFPKAHILGVDICEYMINYSKERFAQKDNCKFMVSDFDDLAIDVPLAPFDLAISNSSMHWAKRPINAYKSVYQILTYGGTIAIHQGGKNCYLELQQLAESILKRFQIWDRKFQGFLYPAFYPSKEEYRNLLTACGFTHISIFDAFEKPTETIQMDFLNFGLFPYLARLDRHEIEQFKEKYIEEAQNLSEITVHRLYIVAKKYSDKE